VRAIEDDSFPFEFLSRLAERESWRKEIHRPIYHVHKWWAKRLGSVFRGILLGAVLEDQDLRRAFHERKSFANVSVFDPFMGSGTTIGEAHKLGMTAIGRDINPVAVEAVRVALGPLNKRNLQKALVELLENIGERIAGLYRSTDAAGRECDVLYYFWVMQAACPECGRVIDLFPSYVVASNAYPKRKPEVHVVCPKCGDIFRAADRHRPAKCRSCATLFQPDTATARGAKATCTGCGHEFSVTAALGGKRPNFRLYGKLVLSADGQKQYLAATESDEHSYRECSRVLQREIESGSIDVPSLILENGYNTRQAIGYGFTAWRDFFNDRQLLALAWLRRAILRLNDVQTRDAMMVLFSGVLEFNNLFTSYKGEGTGAVRHMFAHHILKPERVPIEANVWGTPKSSGSFTGLFRGRLLRALEYREAPTEINGASDPGLVCSSPFSGQVHGAWPTDGNYAPRAIYVSCGDSASSSLADQSIDLVVTDPPFFDNVHYSELADFFHAWRLPEEGAESVATTRHIAEVQDSDAVKFGEKLEAVFHECNRVLKHDGLLIFSYHHSRGDGWRALAHAVLGAGFVVVNAHPVKSEMSVATPKTQAKEPIQFDIVLVCRKASFSGDVRVFDTEAALESARQKIRRIQKAGFELSRNDRKIAIFGQLLSSIRSKCAVDQLEAIVERELESVEPLIPHSLVAA
jgi:putative DNA methylase